jgi:hypothetical protein
MPLHLIAILSFLPKAPTESSKALYDDIAVVAGLLRIGAVAALIIGKVLQREQGASVADSIDVRLGALGQWRRRGRCSAYLFQARPGRREMRGWVRSATCRPVFGLWMFCELFHYCRGRQKNEIDVTKQSAFAKIG